MFAQMITVLLAQMLPGMLDSASVISVVGVAYAQVQPDMAELWISVYGQDSSEKDAYQLCWKNGKELVKALKKSGAKAEDIRTGSIVRVPKESYDSLGMMLSTPGYQMDVNLKVYDLSKIPKIIRAALGVESAQVNQVAYNSYKLNESVQKVLPEALADAEIQAKAMAKAAGVDIETTPVAMSTNPYYPPGQAYSCVQGWCPPPGSFLEVPVYVYVTYKIVKK